MTWKISEKKIAAWIVTSLYVKYRPASEDEAQKIMEKKRIKVRYFESKEGYALATMVDGRGKVIAQTPVLNFIEYEN